MTASLRSFLRRKGWPSYECQLCVGQSWWEGCYCAYHGAYSPGSGDVPFFASITRWVYSKLYGKEEEREWYD